MKTAAPGQRVRFTAPFLRSTGQYTGPDEPTSIGPFARGMVTDGDLGGLSPARFAMVKWDDGRENLVNVSNLERSSR